MLQFLMARFSGPVLLALLSALHYGHVNGFVVARTTLGRALPASFYHALGSAKRTIPFWHVGMVLLCAFIGWLVARFF